MYVCMYVYVCMYICMYVYIYINSDACEICTSVRLMHPMSGQSQNTPVLFRVCINLLVCLRACKRHQKGHVRHIWTYHGGPFPR